MEMEMWWKCKTEDFMRKINNNNVTWQHLPPAAAWQTAGEYAGTARSRPSAPGSVGGYRPWWGSGMFVTWRLQKLKRTVTRWCHDKSHRKDFHEWLRHCSHNRTHQPSAEGPWTKMKIWIWYPQTQSGFHQQAEPSDPKTKGSVKKNLNLLFVHACCGYQR